MENQQRNYDENPIKIIDYGVLFELSIGIIIFTIAFPFIVIDLNNIYQSRIFFNFEALRVYVLISVATWFFYKFFISYPNNFKNNKSYFLFTNEFVEYYYFGENKDYKEIQSKIELSQIRQIDFCIICELPHRYARWHKLTAWQLYRQSSIGVHIGKATIFLRYLVQYILFVFPYKLWRLYKTNEELSLLNKNIFIHFSNRNYFLVNIYKKNELNDLLEYFKCKNINISKSTHFIPHLQNHSLFMDKEEIWTNDFK